MSEAIQIENIRATDAYNRARDSANRSQDAANRAVEIANRAQDSVNSGDENSARLYADIAIFEAKIAELEKDITVNQMGVYGIECTL